MDGTRNIVSKSGGALIDAASSSNVNVKNPYAGSKNNRDGIINSIVDKANNGQGGNNSNIVIESGAIQIHSTGNAEYDGDRLLQILENKIMEKQNASLS